MIPGKAASVSREELMHVMQELLDDGDVLLLKVHLMGLPEIETKFGQDSTLKAREFVDQLLSDNSKVLAIGEVNHGIFGLLCKQVENPLELASELIRAVRDLNREHAFPFIFEVAVGGVLGERLSKEPVSVWFERADLALQAARTTGKPQLFGTTMLVEHAVRDALSRLTMQSAPPTGMSWVYQPVNRTSDGQVVGYEVLCRWNMPGIGAVSPAVFIGVAEKLNLVHLIDLWGLRQLVKTHDAILETGVRSVGVNLSPRTIGADPEILDEVIVEIFAAESLGLDLVVEVTETALADNHDQMLHLLRELRRSGVSIAIDDFGSGHTNLSAISEMPCEYLKVDASLLHFGDEEFVVGLLEVSKKLADLLGAQLLVEGIETEEQLELARSAGATLVQGWFFGQPRSFG